MFNFEEPIENYNELDEYTKDAIKNYVLEFANRNDWLEKRLTTSFSRNSWIQNYFTKDDLRQEFYLNMYRPTTLGNFMKRKSLDRFKYINSVFSNVLTKMVQEVYGRPVYPLNEDLEVSINNTSSFEEQQQISDLFLNETLEKQVVWLLREGLSGKEIMEQLDISRRSFDKIKQEIKRKIIESESD